MPTEDYKAAYLKQKAANERLKSEVKDLALGQKNQTAQSTRNQKLALIGELAPSIAHEISNPTSFVKSNVEVLKRYTTSLIGAISDYQALLTTLSPHPQSDTAADIKQRYDLDFICSDLDDSLEETLVGISRIENSIKALKYFSLADEKTPIPFNITSCIENALDVVSCHLKHQAKITTTLNSIPDIVGKPREMTQALINLMINAAEAMKSFGTINISTKTDDTKIFIFIEDNGRGIEPSHLNQIFEPFYTSKGIEDGAVGLGLSSSQHIVKNHGGEITVQSTLDKGTTATITLPITGESSSERQTPK